MTRNQPAAPTTADLTWTLLMVRRTVSLHKHLPRLTAAEWVMDSLPLESERFALSRKETLDLVLDLLD
ncbi:hypothetical protein DVJ83_18035 (plasmid) [Deinococcus wulumuqiensis]|uniref:Uncharacterized protein n=1 Tax=Deinococcus wulumuqiensis TaxID=980427 RepID=A0A345IMS5_9DEIO|nr:hypothetical protein [Deinococcus wulumuqiensis]AXH00998.1 hypothetical protein DVJ83_18035 [Deinococcus wulumuqiensis]